MENNSNLTLQGALDILFHKMGKNGRRDELRSRVGSEMYDKLLILGFIADGSTINPVTKERIRVWKKTNKPNLFDEITREQSEEEIQFLNRHMAFSL